jgi:hypothetical protein
MRELSRETLRAHECIAAHTLVEAVAGGRLVMLLAPQVQFEFDENVQGVQDDLASSVRKLKNMLARIDGVVGAFGGVGRMDTSHLDGHLVRARALVDRWMAAATPIAQSPEIAGRALQRVNAAKTPARKGKESTKDCVVIETYLDFVAALRGAGHTGKVVFVSSNKTDYAGDVGAALKPDLAADFAALDMVYQPNLSAALHALDLGDE